MQKGGGEDWEILNARAHPSEAGLATQDKYYRQGNTICIEITAYSAQPTD